MKTKLNGILTLLLALVAQVAFAQQTVTGTVTDPDGLPILGATVQVKDTQTFTTTDFDGKYSIEAGAEDTLVFSYTGYDNQNILVGQQSIVDVTMKTSLEEVVVQAYRNTTKLTSNVSSFSVSGEETEDRPNANILQRLQGAIPGLRIQTNSGQPGADPVVQLRGASSINGNTEPLFIVDGIPVRGDVFSTFNPNDIESTTVLKDGAGTAIYGNRGANGVIIIKTKGGNFNTPLSITYSNQTGFSQLIAPDYNLYDSRGILELENRTGLGGLGATLQPEEIDDFATTYDWEDAVFRTGINQVHNLALNSGSENLTQFTSLGYTDQEGTLRNTDLQRFNLRSNISGKSDNGKFKFGTTALMAYTKSKASLTTEGGGSNLIYFNPVRTGFYAKPYLNPADYPEGGANADNLNPFFFDDVWRFPFVTLDNFRNRVMEDRRLRLNVGGNASYKISDNWSVRYEAGFDYNGFERIDSESPVGALAQIRSGSRSEEFEGIVDEDYSRDFRFNSNLSLSWTKKFGKGETDEEKKHTVLANAYLEYVKGHLKSFGFTQTGLDPRTYSPGDGAGFIPDNGNNDDNRPALRSNKNETGLFSYFGEFDYDYDKKYGVYAVVRRDNSFRFAGDNKWGTFFSGALRWNVTSEDFMKDSKIFDLLQVKLSYGEVGNERIQGGFYDGLSLTRQQFATGQGYRDQQTFVRSATIGNPDLRWETIATTNLNIGFQMFDRRLRGTIDLYNRQTSDLFFQTNVSGINGVYSIDSNLGDIQNRGVELGISYDILRANNPDQLGVNVFFNGSYNRNKVLDIDIEGGVQELTNTGGLVIQEGEELNSFFTVPFIGVNPANGNLLYQDINGNPTETPTNEDRRLSGKSTNPDFQGGFGANFTYKNFFVETQFNFITGIAILDLDLEDVYNVNDIGLFNLSADLERSWTPDNRVTDMPSLNASNLVEPVDTDRFIADTDFLRFRFAQIGYNFPASMLDNTFLTSGRVYMNAENLITWTKFRGSDPEQARNFTIGRYPTPRIFGIGLDLKF